MESVPKKELTMKYLVTALSILVAGLLGFLVASCGSDGAESAGPVPTAPAAGGAGEETVTAESPTTTEEDGSGAEDEDGVVHYQVWFHEGELLYAGFRSRPHTRRVGSAALEDLLAGPSAEEADDGAGSAIPTETRLLGLVIDDGIAHVDLTSEFESGGGSLSMQMRLAQVVFTLTQFPTVEGVLFRLDGEPVEVLGGEGIVVDEPLRRRDFAQLLPVILVESPKPGQRVDNPVSVSGSANVFEANVTVRVLDEAGREIANTFTTATCGTGCRGTFSVSVPYDVDRRQPGTLVVHDDDAAGVGRPPHEVRIPVVLTP